MTDGCSMPMLCVPSDKPQTGSAGLSACEAGSARVAGSSSLEDSETNPQAGQTAVVTKSRWHGGHEESRRAIWSALVDGDGEGHLKRANRIQLCCSCTELRRGESGSVQCIPQRCRDRACPSCSVRRSIDVGERAANAVQKLDAPRFCTLTMPAVNAPLRTQLRQMRYAFAELRKQRRWMRAVVGGVYTIQITRNARTGLWHPHLHCIIDGDYFPQDQLRECWRESLNRTTDLWSVEPDDALIVDIRAVPSRNKAAKYIARYVCSPNEIATWSADAIREYCDATKGQRMITLFGSLHGVKLIEKEDDAKPDLGEFVTTFEVLNRHANGGDAVTRRALSILGSVDQQMRRLSSWADVPPSVEDLNPDASLISWAWGILRTRYLYGWSKAADEADKLQRNRLAQRAASRLHLWSDRPENLEVG